MPGPQLPADRKIAGDVRVRTGGKGCYFFVTYVDPLNSFLSSDGISYPVERIADDPVDSPHPPL